MYYFTMSYDNDENSIIYLPLSPKSYKTKVKTANKTIDLIKNGEINILKDVGLREFEFEILLPKDDTLVYYKNRFKEPIFYLNKFRNFVINKKPIRFIIIRKLQNGAELFETNLLVSIEDYEVTENAGEEGDFYVKLKLKEYRTVSVDVLKLVDNEKNKTKVVKEASRVSKEPGKNYKVKKGDTLWKIAQLQLGNGDMWKQIADLNGIINPNKLQIGQVLKLR